MVKTCIEGEDMYRKRRRVNTLEVNILWLFKVVSTDGEHVALD
jgi:hypothetical protein